VQTLDHDALIALAVYFGKARLIDNTVLRYHEGRVQFS
jgi:pantothenate synthetase